MSEETKPVPTPTTASTKRERSDSPSEQVDERSLKRANTGIETTSEEAEKHEVAPVMIKDEKVNEAVKDETAPASAPVQVETAPSNPATNTG